MRKNMTKILIACIFCILMTVPAGAQSIPEERLYPRLVDEADLLSVEEERELREQLDEISERQEFDVVIVTVDSLNGSSPAAFADDFYDYSGYGMGNDADGALFLISMEERDWYISTCGFGITAITDAGLDYMSEKFLPDLSDGDYAGAFETFAELCDDFVTQARKGNAYDEGNLPREIPGLPFVVGALVFGLLFAEIPMLIMKGKMKTVRRQNAAGNYVKNGSQVVRKHSDRFLYHTVTRKRKPKESSSGGSSVHRSSSGRSHGGGGGKF